MRKTQKMQKPNFTVVEITVCMSKTGCSTIN